MWKSIVRFMIIAILVNGYIFACFAGEDKEAEYKVECVITFWPDCLYPETEFGKLEKRIREVLCGGKLEIKIIKKQELVTELKDVVSEKEGE